jgi:hypothetical protein
MYKVITHNITEQHYDHPAALEMLGVIHHGNVKLNSNIHHMSTTIKSTINDAALTNIARRNVRGMFAHYNGRMRDLIIAVGNGTADQATLSQALNTAATAITSNYASYYPTTTAATFTQNFMDFTTSATGIVSGIYAGNTVPPTASQTLNTTSINNLATLLATTSPSSYTLDSVITLLTNISKFWQDQATARKAQDWPADVTAAAKAEDVIISGSVNTSCLADQYMNALFLDWPNRF